MLGKLDSFKEKNFYNNDVDMHPPEQSKLSSKKVGRNEPCLCGSGKKYKKCCLY